MKRKRGELLGDDGEFITPVDEKAKHGEAPRHSGRSSLVLTTSLVIVLGIAIIGYFRVAQTSSMMPVNRLRNGKRLLRISAIVMPVTVLIASDQIVNWMVFCIDSR